MNARELGAMASRIHAIADADPRIRAMWGGDGSSPELLHAYAVLVLIKGEDVTIDDVHTAWSIVTSVERPDHLAIVPMSRLTPDVQDLDQPYADAVAQVARERLGRRS